MCINQSVEAATKQMIVLHDFQLVGIGMMMLGLMQVAVIMSEVLDDDQNIPLQQVDLRTTIK